MVLKHFIRNFNMLKNNNGQENTPLLSFLDQVQSYYVFAIPEWVPRYSMAEKVVRPKHVIRKLVFPYLQQLPLSVVWIFNNISSEPTVQSILRPFCLTGEKLLLPLEICWRWTMRKKFVTCHAWFNINSVNDRFTIRRVCFQ